MGLGIARFEQVLFFAEEQVHQGGACGEVRAGLAVLLRISQAAGALGGAVVEEEGDRVAIVAPGAHQRLVV